MTRTTEKTVSTTHLYFNYTSKVAASLQNLHKTPRRRHRRSRQTARGEGEKRYVQLRVIEAKRGVPAATRLDRKDKPVRWLIVFVATMSAFFLSIMVLILMEKLKQLKKKMT